MCSAATDAGERTPVISLVSPSCDVLEHGCGVKSHEKRASRRAGVVVFGRDVGDLQRAVFCKIIAAASDIRKFPKGFCYIPARDPASDAHLIFVRTCQAAAADHRGVIYKIQSVGFHR